LSLFLGLLVTVAAYGPPTLGLLGIYNVGSRVQKQHLYRIDLAIVDE
jgi:hypothetical protein